jgi:dipeptidase E
VGASAGALIVGPSTEPVTQLDDPAEAPALKSLAGLGFVDFVVLPHYGDETLSAYQAVIDEYGNRFELIPLRDDQAIVVEADGSHRLVPSPAAA